jgi:DNA-binding GntR family transcriptional regulator
MEELFELRTILEGYTLRLISEIFTEKTLERLHEFIENAEDALKRKKIDEVYKWNTQFHDMLHSLVSHKNRLYQMILNIRKYVLRYRRDSLHYLDGAERAIDGHRKILMALRLRDPDLCERVMRNHVQEAK